MARRLDHELVLRGLRETRTRAQAAIAAGCVSVNGVVVRKASQRVDASAHIQAAPDHPYVSRGALKLSHGLDVFGVDPRGRYCLVLGASTGGFTDVLLARGAEHVIAVDVGRDQLHPKLAGDPRVVDASPLDARCLTRDHFVQAPSVLVCDVSFISLGKMIAQPLALAAPDAELVALFKPQFEVGWDHIGKGGLVRADAPVDGALAAIKAQLADLGWPVVGDVDSPIAGGDGNRERLLHAVRGRPG